MRRAPVIPIIFLFILLCSRASAQNTTFAYWVQTSSDCTLSEIKLTLNSTNGRKGIGYCNEWYGFLTGCGNLKFFDDCNDINYSDDKGTIKGCWFPPLDVSGVLHHSVAMPNIAFGESWNTIKKLSLGTYFDLSYTTGDLNGCGDSKITSQVLWFIKTKEGNVGEYENVFRVLGNSGTYIMDSTFIQKMLLDGKQFSIVAYFLNPMFQRGSIANYKMGDLIINPTNPHVGYPGAGISFKELGPFKFDFSISTNSTSTDSDIFCLNEQMNLSTNLSLPGIQWEYAKDGSFEDTKILGSSNFVSVNTSTLAVKYMDYFSSGVGCGYTFYVRAKYSSIISDQKKITIFKTERPVVEKILACTSNSASSDKRIGYKIFPKAVSNSVEKVDIAFAFNVGEQLKYPGSTWGNIILRDSLIKRFVISPYAISNAGDRNVVKACATILPNSEVKIPLPTSVSANPTVLVGCTNPDSGVIKLNASMMNSSWSECTYSKTNKTGAVKGDVIPGLHSNESYILYSYVSDNLVDGCYATIPNYVITPKDPSLNISINGTSCNATATIGATPGNSTNASSYSYYANIFDKDSSLIQSNVAIASPFSMNANELYEFYVKDSTLCKSPTSQFYGKLPPHVTLKSFPQACENIKGKINVTIKNGYGILTVKLFNVYLNKEVSSTDVHVPNELNDSLNINFNELDSGYYKVIVTDFYGCSDYAFTKVIFNGLPRLIETKTVNESCTGKINGSFNFNIDIKNIGEYNIHLYGAKDTVVNNNIVNYLAKGLYYATITDVAGCSIVVSNLKIDTAGRPVIMKVLADSISCLGVLDGKIRVNAKAGIGSNLALYEIKKLNNNFIKTRTYPDTVFTLLDSGNYILSVTDNNGCYSEKSGVKIGLYKPSISFTNLSSFSNCKGSLLANLSANKYTVNNKTFELVKEGKIIVQTQLSPNNSFLFHADSGSHFVNAYDGNGCKLTSEPINLVIKKAKITSASIDYNKCLGEIKISAIGNSDVFKFYNRYTKFDSSQSFQNGPYTFNHLSVNSYYVKVKDTYGCFSDSLKRDIQNEGPSYFYGGYPFLNYLSCASSISLKAFFQNAFAGRPNYILLINSKNDTITKEAVSNSLYKIGPLANDTYKMLLVDPKGCKSPETSLTIDYFKPVINLNSGFSDCLGKINLDINVYNSSQQNKIQCFQGLNLVAPNSYSNLSAEFINLTKNQTYNIKVTDAYNCEKDTQVFITNLNPIPTFVKDTIIYNNCKAFINIVPKFFNSYRGTVVLINSSSIGIDTIWNAQNNENIVFHNILSGDYTIELIDSFGCKNSKNIKINISRPLITINLSYNNCKYNITVQPQNNNPGSLLYQLDNVSTLKYPDELANTNQLPYIFKEISDGSYRLSVTDAYGCKDSILKVLSPITKPKFSLGFPKEIYENCGVTINVKAYFGTGLGDSIFIKDTTNSIIDFKNEVISNMLYSFINKENKYIKVVLKNYFGCIAESNLFYYKVNYDSTYFKSLPIVRKNTNCTGAVTVNGHFGNIDILKSKYGTISIYKLNTAFSDSSLNGLIKVYCSDTSCSFDQLIPGWYNVVIKDMAGCETRKRINVNIKLPSVELSNYYESCAGNINAIASNLNSYNSKLILTYLNISDSVSIQGDKYIFKNLYPGVWYNVVVKDSLGCFGSSELLIDKIGVIPEFKSGNPSIIYDSCTRKIKSSGIFYNNVFDSCHIYLYKNGSSNPYYTFYKVKSDSAYEISNIENGSYRIVLEDDYGCLSSASNKVVNYNIPSLRNYITYENCHGVINARGIVSNKLKVNRFRLINSLGTIANEKLSTDTFVKWTAMPGIYKIYLMDGYNCEVNAKDTIENLEAKPIFVNKSYYENCKGTVYINPSYNNVLLGKSKILLLLSGDINYKVIDSTTSGVSYYIKNLPNNSYKIKVVDGAGCSSDTTNVINVLKGPSLSNPIPNYNNCKRGIIVTDSVQNKDGNSWLYLLKVGLPTDSIIDSLKVITGTYNFNNLNNGAYKFSIRDAAGCSLSTQIPTVISYSTPTMDLDSGYENCLGKIIIKANVSDTIKLNTYILDFASAPDSVKTSRSIIQSFINLPLAATYKIKFKDGYNCEISNSIYIPDLHPHPSFVSGYPTRIYEYCHGTFKIKANFYNSSFGNNKIHIYKNNDLDSTHQYVLNDTEYSFINRDTSIYDIRLQDAAGCITKSENIKVEIKDLVLKEALLGPFENCLGQIILKSNTGNLGNKLFHLIGDTTLLSPLATDSIYVFQKINGNPAKTFYAKVSDTYGCANTLPNPIMVRIDENPLIQLLDPGYEKCKGTLSISTVFNNDIHNNLNARKIELFDSSNNRRTLYDSVLSASQFKYSNLNTGKYFVKVFDGYGCYVKSKAVEIKINEKPSFKTTPIPLYENCSGSLDIKPIFNNGGYNNRIQLLSMNAFPEVDSVRFDNSEGYYFRNLSKGEYKIKLLDSYGCSDSITSIKIDTIIPPYFQYVNTSYANCMGRIDLAAKVTNLNHPAFLYLLNSPLPNLPLKTRIIDNESNFNFDSLINNSYWIKIRDDLGCEVISSEKFIDLKKAPVISVSYPKVTYLKGIPNITAKALVSNYGVSRFSLYSSYVNDLKNSVDSVSYFSATDSFIFTNSRKKFNWIKITDTLGCQSMTIPVQPLDTLSSPKIFSVNVVDIKCYNDASGSIIVNSVINSGSGLKTYCLYKYSGVKYFILDEKSPVENNKCVFNGLGAGKYKVEVKDYRGSSEVKEDIVINQPSLPLSLLITTSQIKCNGDKTASLEATASGGTSTYLYRMNNGAYSEQNIFNSLGAGNYIISASDNNGCTVSETINLNEPSKLVITSASIKTDLYGHALQCSYTNDGKSEIVVQGGSKPYKISWFNNNKEINGDSLQAGLNKVFVTDANLCIDS
jgi:hypothetical protein